MALSAAHTSSAKPSVDRTAAERVLSSRMLHNIVQGLIWANGRGVDETYTDDGNQLEIRVIKHEGITSGSRTIGEDGTTNNKYFNTNNAEQPAHDTALIKLNEVYDRPQQIPQLMEDVISINILNIHSQRIEERVRMLMNGYILAKKAKAALNYAYEESDTSRILDFNEGTDDMLDVLQDAFTLLDDGDPDNFIDTFPLSGRVAVFDRLGKKELMKAGGSMFEVGSSRAVELLEIGSAGSLVQGQINTEVNGFFGVINQTPLHFMSSSIVKIADEYLDYETGDDELHENLHGIVSSSVATGRAFGISRSTKIVDTRGGQGFELQPLVRWGATVFYPKGIVLIMDNDYTNPANATNDVLTMEGVESKST